MKEATFILVLACIAAILIIGLKYGIMSQRISALESFVDPSDTSLIERVDTAEKNIVVITKAMDHNFKFISGTLEGHLGEIIRLEDKINDKRR